MRKTLSLVLAVLMVLALLPAAKFSAAFAEEAVPTYTKVESADDLTDGSYLIVVDSKKIDGAYYAFNGADANSYNKVDVEIADGVIEGDYAANEITIAAVEGGGFTLKNSAGKYLGAGSNNSNTIVFGDTAVVNAIDFTDALTVSINMTTDVARELKLNNSNDQSWFRYYKVSTSNSNYYLPSLYKKAASDEPDPTAYIVSFNANGGTGTMDPVTTGSPYTLPECGFTAPENKEFSGWAQEGVEAIYNVNDVVELTGDTTFYAQWQEVENPEPEPETTAMELVTEFEGGEEVVIYYPDSSKVVTGNEYYFEHATDSSKNKWELVMADATLTDGVLAVPEEALVLTVEKYDPADVTTVTKDGETEPILYAFRTADNQYLYADSSDVKLVEPTADNEANTLFQLEAAENGFYIKCDSAVDANSNALYLEYYKGYFTAFKMGTTAKYYTFQFFAEPGEEPEPPVIEPTGDTIILFTNDVHCQVDYVPTTFNDDGSVKEAGAWGYSRVAALKNALIAAGNEVILVDAGDHVQGGVLGSLTYGEAIIDIMNAVGYDLAIPGNHEFDYDMTHLFGLIEQANYPYISANFVNLIENTPNGLVLDAYKIFEANGKKIAFVGLSTPESIVKSTPTYFMNEAGQYIYGFCQDETGAGVYTAAQNAINAAREEGEADYVILLGHMGVDAQSSPWMSTEVIENITGADAFIDGHSHSTFVDEIEDADGNPVLHGQTGTKLANVGKLTIAADGTLTMELLPVDNEIEPDPETQEVIDTIEEEFAEFLDQVVARTDYVLTINDPDTGKRAVRKAETNLGDLCADAYRSMFDADIAFVNGGGVRSNIEEGEFTYEDVLKVHPFGNTAVLAEVTGQQILDALEMGSRLTPNAECGGFLQVSGLTYEIHTYLEPNVTLGTDGMWTGTAGLDEYRVKNVQVMNKESGEYEPLDLEKTYTLAGHNYMLMNDGDGYTMFGKNITILQDSGIADYMVLINYVQTMPAGEDEIPVVTGYEDPRGEGRIVLVEEAPVEPTGDTIILFTNDVHCQVDYSPMTFKEDGTVDKKGAWGYSRLAALKKALIAAGNEVLLVDAGDHVQGGELGSLTQGEAIIDIMNAAGYDLAIPGNHEFDYNMPQFFALVEQANYPYISANFVNLVENNANGTVFDAYKIFEANGKKIAFVGLSTPESIVKSTPTYFMNDAGQYIYGFCQDETGAGVYTAAQNAINAAREEGEADYVILLGHMGVDAQSSPWMSTEVIANITGADAFIDGHSHSTFVDEINDAAGNPVLSGQTGTKFENVGKLTIKADGTLTMELLPVDNEIEPDPETQEVIDTIEEEFAEFLGTVVAYTDHLLTINDPDTGKRAVRKAETNLGDLCADAYRSMFDADIAFVNGGGVRADIAEGDITYANVIKVHPFGNTAVLAEVTGQQILDALEMGSRLTPNAECGGFLQVSGLTYEIHSYLEPNVTLGTDGMWTGTAGLDEYRVKNVQVMNKESGEYEPLDLEKTYTLASHNYMLKDTGDGYGMFGKNITILQDSGIADYMVLINYIQTMPVNENEVHTVTGYTDPRGEGRITIVPEKLVTFYGEDVKASDVAEEVDDELIYRYDVKVKNIDPEISVVGMQAFVEYDNEALTFVEATSTLEGSTGVNENNGVISFAWASNGEGITVEDGFVVVSLYFKLNEALEDGSVLDFYFVYGDNDTMTGFSYVVDDTVVEADNVVTEDGSMTFSAPKDLTIYGEDVMSTDVMVVENGERLYRYDIRVKDLPEAGLKVNSAQIFLTYGEPLVFRRAEGALDWIVGEKNGKLMFSWASDTPELLNNEEVVLSIFFAAPNANGEIAEIAFTMNALNTVSAMSVIYGGSVYEIEAETIDGSITFAEVVLGDANCDGQVTAADAALILRSLVGLNELTAQGALNADVDGDGEVTAEDAAIILRYIVKLIEQFPVEE